jgi:ATPase subunit of ABC transporter with duplicated ATPase domains
MNQGAKFKSLHTNVINNKYNNDDSGEAGEFFCRKCLGDIGLESKTHHQKISTLSGGQKARVVFASLFVEKPHLILFDEPTNHLDMETVDAMIDSVSRFKGAVVTITHNIDLIESTQSTIYELCDGNLSLTDFDSYSDKMLCGVEQY